MNEKVEEQEEEKGIKERTKSGRRKGGSESERMIVKKMSGY